MRRENPIQTKIRVYLESLENSIVERREAGGFSYKKGRPDLWCVYKGKHYEIEVKDPKGDTTIMQDKQKIKLEKAGCIYILAKTLDDVRKVINEEE